VSAVGERPAPEAPTRYDRTYGGLVASLLVTVLVVVGYVGLRALNRDDLEVRPEPVDYAEAVGAAQDAGFTLVYPRQLPDGWIVTRLAFERGERPAWGMDLLTEDGSFVGLRQEDDDVEDLLSTYVDEHPSEGDAATLDSQVATSWQEWSDEGGDHAYSADAPSVDGEAGGSTLLVYGSASEEEQVELIGLLVTDPLAS
jgi:hypothetical protein